MIGKFLCWLGIHHWIRKPTFYGKIRIDYLTCDRCGTVHDMHFR